MNDDKNNKLTFKDVISNKQYRAILYLAVYFIIFLILILMVRIGSNGNTGKPLNNNEKVITEGFNSIKNKNFNFKYTLTIDNKEYVYSGKQYGDKLLFTLNNDSYYVKEDVYLKKVNDNYVLTDEKVKYFNFLDVDLIENIVTKITNADEKYLLSMKDFIKIIDSKLELTEDKNMVVKLTKPNNIITKVQIDLSDYASLSDKNNESVSLLLEYNDFGLIEDFDIK